MLNFRDKSFGVLQHSATRTILYKMKFKSKFTVFFVVVQLLSFSQTEAKNQSKKAVQSPLEESSPLLQNQSQQDTTYLNEVILNDLKAPLGPNFRGATQVILGSSDLLPFRTRG